MPPNGEQHDDKMDSVPKTSSSPLLQILLSTVGDEALDLIYKAMKELSEFENFRYHPRSGRLEVLLPMADEDLWIRRRTVQTLKDFLEDDDQYAVSDVPGEEYTFWLAQCVHYGLEFPTTTEDAKMYLRGAIAQGIKKEPPHFRILWKFLKRQYLEMYEEIEDSQESDGDDDDDDDQMALVGPKEEEPGFDMVDDDNDCQVIDWFPKTEDSDVVMTDGAHDADDEDESVDTELGDRSDSTDDDDEDGDDDSDSDVSDSDSDADMDDSDSQSDGNMDDDDDGKDNADDTKDADDQEDHPDINITANEDGISGLGDNAATPDHQQCEPPAPQSVGEPQPTLAGSAAAAIEEVDLSQESPTSIYDLPSDSDSQLINFSNNPGQEETEEASYDAALKEHIDYLYNEDEYDNFSEYDAGPVATDINDLRSSSRATRSSANKDRLKTGGELVEAPSLSPVYFIDLDGDLGTGRMCQEPKRNDNTQQKEKSSEDRKSEDLPNVEDLLPSTTHNNKSARVEADMSTAGDPDSNTYTVKDQPSSQFSSESNPAFLHISTARSQDSVLESIEACSPNSGIPQTLRLTEREELGKGHIKDKEGATAIRPAPSATSTSFSYSEFDRDDKDSRALPLKMRAPSGNDTDFIVVPRGPKAWSSPCRSSPGSLSGVTADSPLLTPSPKESRFLRQSIFRKAKGAGLKGEHGTPMLDSFSSVTAESTILSTPFVRNTAFPTQIFANQTVRDKLQLAEGMNDEQSDQAREHQNVVNWHRQEYQRLREVNNQHIRKEHLEADVVVEQGSIQQPTSAEGKNSAEDGISPSFIGNHRGNTHQRNNSQQTIDNVIDCPQKKQCLETPSKKVERSRGRGTNSGSSTGKETSTRKANSATHSAAGGCSTKERFLKEGSCKAPTTNETATTTEKNEPTNRIPKKQSRGVQFPTETRAFKAAAAEAKSEMSFPSIRYDANQTSEPKSIKAANNLNRHIIDSQDATSKRDKDKKRTSNPESLMPHAKSSKPDLAWESITYTSNPMAGRRPGSYRLDSLEPQHFRDVITIANPVARAGQSLRDLPPPRHIPTRDQGAEQPLELQWVEQRRAFKKRKLDEFMASVPEDSLLKDRVPVMVSEPKGLRIEYV